MDSNSSAATGAFSGALGTILERGKAAANGSLGHRRDLQAPSISQRLERKFGLGESPQKRRALYKQLEMMHDRWPDQVARIISEAVVGAAQALHPDRYFCKAVKQKLQAEGLRLSSDEAVQW